MRITDIVSIEGGVEEVQRRVGLKESVQGGFGEEVGNREEQVRREIEERHIKRYGWYRGPSDRASVIYSYPGV